MNIKRGIEQFKQDILDWYKGILAAFVYIIVSNWAFGTVCTLAIATGLPCPACGLTRAGFSFLTFQWADAWNYNCVIFLIVPFILYCVICRYGLGCKCRGCIFWLIIIVICLIMLYTYRMINFFPDVEPVIYRKENLLRFLRNTFL
ncbi:MAG: DUF2752 domain-containing protein [Lachnospiraceae bacterium]|nr:DUF2752 domain-containing protein [Lachnospiraceae bacterium]